MGRIGFRNKQAIWYALYDSTVADYDSSSYQTGTHVSYKNPVKIYGNVSPARGAVMMRQFGEDENYDKVIVLGDRNTAIDENTVLWIDSEPELDANGALKLNASGDYATPWEYIVRRVGRGLPNFGSTVIAVSKVNVS
jgi:hypothetical protein